MDFGGMIVGEIMGVIVLVIRVYIAVIGGLIKALSTRKEIKESHGK